MAGRDDELPDDPSPLGAGAVATHEAFSELIKAGFTEHQALFLLACCAVVREGGD